MPLFARTFGQIHFFPKCTASYGKVFLCTSAITTNLTSKLLRHHLPPILFWASFMQWSIIVPPQKRNSAPCSLKSLKKSENKKVVGTISLWGEQQQQKMFLSHCCWHAGKQVSLNAKVINLTFLFCSFQIIFTTTCSSSNSTSQEPIRSRSSLFDFTAT